MHTWWRDVSVGMLVFALVLMMRMTPVEEPAVMLVPPMVIAAYLGGLRLGLVATGTITIAAAYLLMEPTAYDVVRLASLVVSGVLVSVLCEMLRRAIHRAETSERVYERSFHGSPVPIVMTELDGAVVDANAAYCELVGYSWAELRGVTSVERQISSPGERERVRGLMLREGALRLEPVRIRTKAGDLREALLSAVFTELGGAKRVLTTLVDITDQRRAENAVAESERRFSELAGTIDEVFWMTDVEKTKVYYISPGYERLWGCSCQSLYAEPQQWLLAIHPEDRQRVIDNAREAGESEIEFRISRPDGGVRWIRNRSFRVYDSAGTLVRMAGVAVDITERRKLELELQQAQKMESLGRLAGGVAHDFNNVLAVISTNASILSELIPPGGEDREMVDEITHAVTRACSLTRQLLAFSRKQGADPVVLDVNATITETRKMLARMIGEDVSLETSLDGELPRVKIDPGHLVQVIMNLAVNARDAMPGGGKLVIATRKAANEVRLSITDTGTGMSPEVRARAFEPFFTTKGLTKGTGMGLAVVHGIVRQAGGRIEIDTEVGRGTTFDIYLPITEAPLDERREAVRPAIPRGFENVLVVDDDPYVRATTLRALRSSGYNALDAADGPSALRLLASEKYDLLVTDVVMPGMNGRELAETATAANPMLKVLYTSGYTDDEVVARGVMRGEVEMLEKPFRAEKLASRVREILDASA